MLKLALCSLLLINILRKKRFVLTISNPIPGTPVFLFYPRSGGGGLSWIPFLGGYLIARTKLLRFHVLIIL